MIEKSVPFEQFISLCKQLRPYNIRDVLFLKTILNGVVLCYKYEFDRKVYTKVFSEKTKPALEKALAERNTLQFIQSLKSFTSDPASIGWIKTYALELVKKK